jgi:hypothetical protein
MNPLQSEKERKAHRAKVKKAVEELGIDTPLRLVRVIGDRLELHTPQQVYTWPPADAPDKKKYEDKGTVERLWMANNPHLYNRTQLRQLGRSLGIPGASKMNKVPLVKAIKHWVDELSPEERKKIQEAEKESKPE